ncbi:MAG TPA: endonuclease/exonuclease/phosphatase family protein, partial [Saprospiraceae bacterium]|nr:endonuclease/exonuclease/phosphatase family protein [Saprospiraceae bacterium]
MKRILFFISIFFIVNTGYAQKKYKIRTLAFYNLENLFDTINDVTKNDEASPMM